MATKGSPWRRKGWETLFYCIKRSWKSTLFLIFPSSLHFFLFPFSLIFPIIFIFLCMLLYFDKPIKFVNLKVLHADAARVLLHAPNQLLETESKTFHRHSQKQIFPKKIWSLQIYKARLYYNSTVLQNLKYWIASKGTSVTSYHFLPEHIYFLSVLISGKIKVSCMHKYSKCTMLRALEILSM